MESDNPLEMTIQEQPVILDLTSDSSITQTPKSSAHKPTMVSTEKNKELEDGGAIRTKITDPPDGGYGWLIIATLVIIQSMSIGLIASYGVFQEYYEHVAYPSSSTFAIAMVGTLGSVTAYFAGALVPMISSRIGLRATMLIGSTLGAAGLVAASFATSLWQLYFSQGILFGLGTALVYLPALSVPGKCQFALQTVLIALVSLIPYSLAPNPLIVAQWFQKKRGLAMGIVISGTGIGGLYLPSMITSLLLEIGYPWTMRVLGLMSFGLLGTGSLIVKARLKVERKKKVFDFGPCCKTWEFYSLFIINVFFGMAYFAPLYYIDSYTVFLGMGPTLGSVLTGVCNGVSIISRILTGLAGDRYGSINMLLACGMLAVLSIVIWTFTNTLGGLVVFVVLYGYGGGAFIAQFTIVAANIFGADQMASVNSLLVLAFGIGALVGNPLAGWILDRTIDEHGYTIVAVYSLMVTLAASCGVAWLRVRRGGWAPLKKL
ncbi:major facilitator superfamily domain-containing protein [Endogone sp. FLAS-F59071]|nr:major facilitator superfamily domain-containing protein [Endogone sp. FLAS-F59071]|eukprot:RUS17854.1 major facilitator superfamily domain-containing protein [Endogone sp. FLAS-F59071]